MDTLSQLSRDICAQGNMIKAWNQRLDKFRNRMNRLEDTINNLPGAEDAEVFNPCTNSDTAEEADAILACDNGNGKLFQAEGEDEADEFELVACDGKWKRRPRGLTYHPHELVQVLSTTAIGSQAIVLPDFPEDVCGVIHAVFETSMTAGNGASGAAHNRTAKIGNYVIGTSGFHDNCDACQTIVPVEDASQTVVITMFGSSSGSCVVKLVGYFY